MIVDDEPILRRFRDSDRDQLIALLHQSYLSTWAPHVTEEAWRRWQSQRRPEQYVDALGHEFLVAELGGNVAGMAHWRGDFIHAVHVHSGSRRQGVGSKLLRRAESEIAAAGHDCVRLETNSFNSTSRSFYAAHDYAESSSRPDDEWGDGLTILLLAKTVKDEGDSL